MDDVIIPFVTGENGLHYLEEVIPEENVVAMVAQRMQKLTNAELVHTQLCLSVLCLSDADETFIQGSYRYLKVKGSKWFQMSLLCGSQTETCS